MPAVVGLDLHRGELLGIGIGHHILEDVLLGGLYLSLDLDI